MPVIFEDFDLPCGDEFSSPPLSSVEVTLWGVDRPIVGYSSAGKTIAGTAVHRPDAEGLWSCTVVANDDIVPENTTYQVKRIFGGCIEDVIYISVPASGGPYPVHTLEADPMNKIAPSSLGLHTADLDLHGGGIEVAYAQLVSNVVVTGTGTGFGEIARIPNTNIAVPDIARPVYLEGQLQVSSLSGSVTVQTGIGIAVTGAITGVLGMLDATTWKAVPVDDGQPLRMPPMFVRLDPHSAGTYCLYARRIDTPFAVKIIGSSIIKTSIRAVTA